MVIFGPRLVSSPPCCNSSFSLPTATMDEPSTPKHRKQLNRDQRLMIHTLYKAGHTQRWIADHLNFTLRQVQYVLTVPVTPKKRTGRPSTLSPKQVQKLILFIKSSKKTRQMSCSKLADYPYCSEIDEDTARVSFHAG